MSPELYNVTQYILSKTGPITIQKLDFLLYYAQGWWLAIEGKELFREELIGSVFSPRCEEVWNFYKHIYKNININTEIKIEGKCFSLDEKIEKHLDMIIEVYNEFSCGHLTDFIRKERPYQNSRKGTDPAAKGTKDNIIHKYEMKIYFLNELVIPNFAAVQLKFWEFTNCCKEFLKDKMNEFFRSCKSRICKITKSS